MFFFQDGGVGTSSGFNPAVGNSEKLPGIFLSAYYPSLGNVAT